MTAIRSSRIALACLGLLTFALASLATAQSPQSVSRRPSREPDPLLYEAASLDKVPREWLDDHEAVYLARREVHEVLADGEARITQHFLVRLNARSSLEVVGDWPLLFDASCEQVELNVARIHKPDGAVVEVPPEDVHIRDENTDFYEFDSYKNVIVSFSQLAVGDVVEVKYTRQLRDPQFARHYFDSYRFYDEMHPVHRSELVVRLPAGATLTYDACGEAPQPTNETNAEAATYRWRMENVAPHPVRDDLPHDNAYAPAVDFSTFATWDELAREVVRLRGDRLQCTPEIHRQVEQITEGLTTPFEKTRALARWCRDEVRYLSIRHGAFGYRPHAPEQVFAKRYGNCNDVCQLLFVMLREAGIEAEFVFLNTDAEVQLSHKTPSPMAEHVILLVEIEGEQHWIDPTAAESTWNQLRGDLRGRKAFAMRGEKLRLLETPPREPRHFKIEQETRIEISPVGDALWSIKQTHHAEAAEEQRAYLASLTPDRRKPAVFGDYLVFYPTARLQQRRRLASNLSEVDQPLATEFAFRVAQQMQQEGEDYVIEPASSLLHQHFSTAFDLQRELPLRVDACEIVETLTVQLPAVFETPPVFADEVVESKWGGLRFTVSTDHDLREVRYTWRAHLNQARVEPEQLEAYNQFLDDVLGYVYASTYFGFPLILDDDRLAAFQKQLAARPLDVEAAAVVIDALRYAEKDELAAKALEKALAAAPDAQVLWDHKVGLAATEVERSETLEQMVRRWPENVEYSLLLAESCLSRRLYDQTLKIVDKLRSDSADDFIRAHLVAMRALLEKKQYKKAEARLAMTRIVDVYLEHDDEFSVLEGVLHHRQGRLAHASQSFDDVLDFDPHHPQALAAALPVAVARHEHALARSLLRRYLAVAESSPEHRTAAARACLSLDRLDDALDLAEAAHAENKHDQQAAAVLILTHAAREEFRQALEVPRQGLDSPDVLAALLQCSLALDRTMTAGEIAAVARGVLERAAEEADVEKLRLQLQRYDALPAESPN
ncbi:MAG: DUF3857 domain-containing protein [Pirellulaceae bacterium]